MPPQSEEQAELQAQLDVDIDEPFQGGFNWNTVWAMFFIAIIMLPGAIYLGLVAGQSMGGAAEWVTIILFLEISRRSLTQLKRQEIIILYWTAAGLVMMGGRLGVGAILFGGPFGGLVWNQYLTQAPQADVIAQHIPSWYSPTLGSDALEARSFLHPDWFIPIVVTIIHIVLFNINKTAMGYVLFRITNDIERLPFPMAPVQSGGATALAESSQGAEGWRWRVFSMGSVIGLIWGAIYIVIPTLSETFLTQTVQVIPIPWIDFTVNLRSILPASILGLATDLGAFLVGFVLPRRERSKMSSVPPGRRASVALRRKSRAGSSGQSCSTDLNVTRLRLPLGSGSRVALPETKSMRDASAVSARCARPTSHTTGRSKTVARRFACFSQTRRTNSPLLPPTSSIVR